jgi:PKD repeat protein
MLSNDYKSKLSWKKMAKITRNLTMIELLTLLLLMQILPLYAAPETIISVQPETTKVTQGENFIITITVSNVNKLASWQVALKYNGTVLSCTSFWIPEDNVFSGKESILLETVNGTTFDGLNYILIGSFLISDSVDVINGILFMANFTVIEYGQTNLIIATKEKPVKFGPNPWDTWETVLLDIFGNEIPFKQQDGIVISGEQNIKPIALFSVIPPNVQNSSFIIQGHPPVGVSFARTFAYMPTIFNASESYDRDGCIIKYIWNFGDGNVTETDSPIITHTYTRTGPVTVELTVLDDQNAAEKATLVLVVGLVLEYFDWSPFIYGLLGLALAILVVSTIRRIIKRNKIGNQR